MLRRHVCGMLLWIVGDQLSGLVIEANSDVVRLVVNPVEFVIPSILQSRDNVSLSTIATSSDGDRLVADLDIAPVFIR